ncbi:MAG: hypothetical protein J07HQX50_01694 [Haloquadratum sp. J07HQX50]|nr:MAG: hypothetical protein J07HQX50_01694 [Haloquadratum sp. J07HQX50]
MLSVLTFAHLACALVLGVIFSSDNLLAVLIGAIGAFLLFPLAVISALLSVGLSALRGRASCRR